MKKLKKAKEDLKEAEMKLNKGYKKLKESLNINQKELKVKEATEWLKNELIDGIPKTFELINTFEWTMTPSDRSRNYRKSEYKISNSNYREGNQEYDLYVDLSDDSKITIYKELSVNLPFETVNYTVEEYVLKL